MKKFIAFALSLAIVGGAAPTMTKYAPDTAITANAAESGTWGDLKYTFTDDGTLTITGTGTMPDSLSPWYQNNNNATIKSEDIKKVIIGSGITTISHHAFDYCRGIESVTIPSTVNIIYYCAFEGCSSLDSIKIPNSVVKIDSCAFYGCNLQSLTLPNSVTEIGGGAFANNSFSSLIIPDSITDIPETAFSYCTNLETVVIPDSVESIDITAFAYTPWFEKITHTPSIVINGVFIDIETDDEGNITFPDSVTSIGKWTLYNWSNNKPNNKTVTIMNPDCEIFDSEATIPSGAVIISYGGSTAQAYAEKYGYTFVALDAETDVAGDINGDGDVTVADATYIMQWAAAPDEYPLSDTAKKNGDVTGGGDGITTSDALAIQQYLSGSLGSLTVGS